MRQAQNGEKEWTLLFYLSADSGNEGGAIGDINALERGVGQTDYDVVVQIDRHPDYDTSNGDWTGCKRFLIEPDATGGNTINSTELADLGEVNMGLPETLSDFIIWGAQNYPAKRYAVMVWGGANIAGIGADMSNPDPIFGSAFDPIRVIFGDLTTALQTATAALDRRIDFLIMWGCNYGGFENDYIIREYADVTARSEIPTNYMANSATDILTWLNANPTADPPAFSQAWVDAYVDDAAARNCMGAWASHDLGPGFVELGLALDTLARELIKAGGIAQPDISAALSGAVDSAQPDLNHFAKLIANTATLPQALRDAAQALIDAYGYPPQAGKPLVNFRFTDGNECGTETWPTGDKSELRGTKIYETDYFSAPIPGYAGPRYPMYIQNNAWHWFLAGETALPAEPLVTYQSNTLSNRIESGSPTPLGLTLRNSGGLTATGITGVLSTTDSTVAITQDTSTFPDITSESAGASQADFSVTVDAATPIGHRIWFWLDLTANAGAYVNTTTFCLEVSGCADGSTRPCYEGPDGTEGAGICSAGTETCSAGTWGTCDNQTLPTTENCTDTLDNDCDGDTDAQDSECFQCVSDADCDDVNPCTDDVCTAQNTCENTNNTNSCDDGDSCTMNDACNQGSCTGAPLDADSDTYISDACGGDDCDDSDGAVHPNAAEVCDDTVDNDCDGFTDGDDPGCAACTTDADCDDDNVCTDDVCDPAQGCRHSFNTAPCDDGYDCTVDDACSNAACRGTIPDEVCDDGVDNDCDGDTDAQDADCGGGNQPGPAGGCSCGGSGTGSSAWVLLVLLVFGLIRAREP